MVKAEGNPGEAILFVLPLARAAGAAVADSKLCRRVGGVKQERQFKVPTDCHLSLVIGHLPGNGSSRFQVPWDFARSPFPGLPAIAWAKAGSRLCPWARVSPGFRFPVPCSPFPAFGSYPQRRMPIRPCKNRQIRVKIDQKGDVFRQKGIKKARISSCPS